MMNEDKDLFWGKIIDIEYNEWESKLMIAWRIIGLIIEIEDLGWGLRATEENYVEEIYKQMPQTEKFQFSCNMSEPEFAEQQIQLCLGNGVQ